MNRSPRGPHIIASFLMTWLVALIVIPQGLYHHGWETVGVLFVLAVALHTWRHGRRRTT